MDDPNRLYQCLLDYCSSTQTIDQITMGQVWTVCQQRRHRKIDCGLAMTPAAVTRTLQWSGTLAGRGLKDLAKWITEWDPHQAAVGMAAVNCSINAMQMPETQLLDFTQGSANLTVFEHFLPLTEGQKVVVIGHYPGIEQYSEKHGWQVLERVTLPGDYPDPASEFLIPEADWVFISASSIPNKTFPRLAELAASAKTVLMGPTVPWLPELYEFGIDYLAGVEVIDANALYQTAAEGGGVRIFETGVRYKLLALTEENNLLWLKKKIADSFAKKNNLTQAMGQWYTKGNSNRFPQYDELNDVTKHLSLMDSSYKKLWDAKQLRSE